MAFFFFFFFLFFFFFFLAAPSPSTCGSAAPSSASSSEPSLSWSAASPCAAALVVALPFAPAASWTVFFVRPPVESRQLQCLGNIYL